MCRVTRHGLRTPLSSTDQRNEWRCEHDQLLVQHYADANDALRLTHSDEPLPDHVPANLLTRRKLLHGRQKLRGAHPPRALVPNSIPNSSVPAEEGI